MSAFLSGYRHFFWQLQIHHWRVHSGITMQHRRAYQAPHTGGVANSHWVKRWTNEELPLLGQVVDPALTAALSSEEGNKVDAERAEGCYNGAH